MRNENLFAGLRRGRGVHMRLRRIALALLALLLAACLGGCFVKTVDELYTLPRHSDEYNRLQAAIDAVLTQGMSYAAPVSGENRQSVQLADLDGDGQDEAIVFLKAGGENPLKVFVFRRTEDGYTLLDTAEGAGTSFECAAYVPLDGGGGLELILGRKLSDQVLKSLCVYKLQEGRLVCMLETAYSEFCTADLNQDGRPELFLLRFDAEARGGAAELYRLQEDRLSCAEPQPLSEGVTDIRRIRTGFLSGSVPAVFVSETCEEGGILTDIFAFRQGALENLTAGSWPAVQNCYVYPEDIDRDGVTELPQTMQLPELPEEGEAYFLLHWYALDLQGQTERKLTTFHALSGGWYLRVDEAWAMNLAVARAKQTEENARGYTFFDCQGEGTPVPAFTIYELSGESRAARAASAGLFVLGEKGETLYAAELAAQGPLWGRSLTQQDLTERFHLIQEDWNTGEM